MAPTNNAGGKHSTRASLQRSAVGRSPSVLADPQLVTASTIQQQDSPKSGGGFMAGAANSTRRVMKAVEEYRRAIELVQRTRRNRSSFPRSSSPKRGGIDLSLLASTNPMFDPNASPKLPETTPVENVQVPETVGDKPKKSKKARSKKKKSKKKKKVVAVADGAEDVKIAPEAEVEEEQQDAFGDSSAAPAEPATHYWDDPMLDMGFDIHDEGSSPVKLGDDVDAKKPVESDSRNVAANSWDDPMLDMGFDLHDGSGPFKLEVSPTKSVEELEAERRASLEEDMRRVSEQMCEWDYWWDWYISALATGEMQVVDRVDVPVSVCNMTTFNTALLEQDNELNPTHPTHLKRDSLLSAQKKMNGVEEPTDNESGSDSGGSSSTRSSRKKSVRWNKELVSYDSQSTLATDEDDCQSGGIRWADNLTTEITSDADTASDASSDSGDSFMDALNLQLELSANNTDPAVILCDNDSIVSVDSVLSYQSLVSLESNEDSQLSVASDGSYNSSSSDASSPSVGRESRKAFKEASNAAAKGPVRRSWAAKKDSGKAARAAARSGARRESVLQHIKHSSHARKSRVKTGGFEEAIAKLHTQEIEQSNEKVKTMTKVKNVFKRFSLSKPKTTRERQSSLVSI